MVAKGDGRPRRRVVTTAVAMLVVLATVTAPVSVTGSSLSGSCQEINGHKYCLVDVWTDQDTVAPGESVDVHAIVENRGSKLGSINTYLGIRQPDGSKRYPSGDNAYDIAVGERVQLDYAATIPSDAPEGDYELTVDVWTGNDAEMFDTSGWLQEFSVVEPTTEAEITSTSAFGTYEPGAAVPIDVTVENTGDTTHEFYVDASLQRPNGNWVTGEGTTVTLRPGERDSLTLDATVPDDASEGTYSVGSGVFHSSAKDDRYDYGQDLDSITVEEPTTAAAIVSQTVDGDTFRPGETVPVDVTVENTGETTHEFYVDASLQTPGGAWFVGDVVTPRLSPGERETLSLTISLSDDATEGSYGAGSAIYHSSAKSDRYDQYGADDALVVEEPTTDAAITATNAVGGTYAPGATIPVDVTVENTGDTTHEFYVDTSHQTPDGAWVTGEATTVALRPGAQQSITLDVGIPDDATEGSYTVGAGVFMSSAKDEKLGGGEERDAFVVEEPTTDATVTGVDAASGTYRPGGTVPVDVTVENTGDTTHEFYVDASHQTPDGAWVTGEATTVDLRPGAQQTVTLDVKIPSDAVEGTYAVGAGAFMSRAKDDKLGGGEERSAFVVEEPTTDAAVTGIDAASATYAPGETVPVDVTVENTGDTTHEFYVDTSHQTPDGAWVTGEATTVALRPGAQQTVTLDVSVPDDATEGSYTVGAGAFVSSAKDDKLGGGEERDAFVVDEPTTDAAVTATDAVGGTYAPGETVPVEVIVENTGDTTHEFYVDASHQTSDGAWVTGEATTVALRPGAQQTVTLDVGIPDDATEGSYTVGAGVFMSSAKDGKLGGGEERDAFVVEEPTTDAAITVVDAASGTYRPGGTVPVDVTVENTGDTTHEFYVDASLQTPGGAWVTGEATTVALRPGAQQTLTLDVRIPDDAVEGTYAVGAGAFMSRAKDDKLGGGEERDAFVVEPPTASVTIVDHSVASESFSPGDSVPVEITLANEGLGAGEFYVDASLQTPDGVWITGEGRTVSLSPDSERTVTLGVALPDDVSAGDYDAGTAVYGSAAKDALIDQATVIDAFSVSGTTDLVVVDHEIPVGTYAPGTAISSSVTVENTGTETATLALDFSLDGVQALTTTSERGVREVTLRPDARRTVDIDSPVPENAPDGDYDGVLTIDVIDDSGRTTRIDTFRSQDAITVSSETVAIDSVAVAPERPVPGESTTVTVTLANAGAQRVDTAVRVGLGDRSASRTTTVPVSDTRTVAVELTAPDESANELVVEAVPESGQPVTDTRTLATANATLSGVVLDGSGTPLPEATVTLAGRVADIDRDGRFRVTEVPPGETLIEVTVGEVTMTRSVTLEPGVERSIELRTGASGSIRSVDAPQTYTVGEPVSVPVTVHNSGDSDATFTLDFNASGVRTLEVRQITVQPGETERVTREVVFEEGGEQTLGVELHSRDGSVVDERSVTLSETPTLLQLTVVDANGDPVSGVDLGVGFNGPKPHTTNDAGITTIPLETPTVLATGDDAVDTWKTLVEYKSEAYDLEQFKQFEVRRGATTRATIELPSSTRVSGRVTAGDDRLTDVEVFVGDVSVYSNQNGRFVIDEGLSPGSYYVRVQKNDKIVLNTVETIEKGGTNLHLEVPESRYESATGLDNYVLSVVDQAWNGDETAAIRDEIYGDVTESDPTFQADGASAHFVTDDGSYYTSGPCAWYNSEEQCEASKVTSGGTESTARALNEGILSGFVYGGEETIEGFKQLLKPIEYLSQLFTLAMEIVRDLGLIEELVAAIPGQINSAQYNDNPYDAGTPENETFADGWYGGYGSFLLVSTVASGGSASATSKAFSTSSKFTKVANKASDLSDAAKKRAFRRQLDGTDSPGDAPDVLDKLDPDTRDQLDTLRRSGDLNSYLAATGEGGAALLNRLDGPTASRTVRQYNAGGLDSDAIQRANRLLDDGDLDSAGYQRMLGMLETKADDPLVDSDLTADDVMDIAESNGDLSETRWAVRSDQSVEGLDDEIVWLEEGVPGDDGTGYQHIVDKHEGDITRKYDRVESADDVEALVNKAITNPDRTMVTSDGKAVFVYRVAEDKKPLTVYVGSNGFVQSAYPQRIGS